MRLFVFGALIRLVLIIYGLWHDSTWAVKYTDVDYLVFTDAARFVYEGESPYKRATYRYTPLLAYLLTPNVYLHPLWGKLLFAFCDILVGLLIQRLLNLSTTTEKAANCKSACKKCNADVLVGLWLLNPIVINVSTRGNAEALVSLAVVSTIYALKKGHIFLGGVLLALSIHMKIYPLIFALPLMVSIRQVYNGKYRGLVDFVARFFFDPHRSLFVLSCTMTFAALTAGFYSKYGQEFLQESLLYHVTRTDHRHNFSLYFYQLYLAQTSGVGLTIGLMAFIPQILLLLAFTWRYAAHDIGTCLFLQTVTFVALNKVATVQYWTWYFALLPLSMAQWEEIRWKYLGIIGLVWVWAVGAWLFFAYGLEMQGRGNWLQLVCASSWLVGAHVLLVCYVTRYTYNPHIRSSTLRDDERLDISKTGTDEASPST